MRADKQGPILLVGGTGKTGGRVARRLEAANRAVTLGSRTGVPPFDWDDRPGWKAVLEGVSAVYITYYPDLSVPGARQAVEEFSNLAVSMGVKRLVLLSGRGEPEAQAAEEALKASGADWTIVRSSWFNQNFSEGAMLDQIRSGTVALPVGDIGEPFIDLDDLADVVVASLTDDKHIGQLYEVTGPRLITFREAVALVAKASGRDVKFVQVSNQEFLEGLASLQLPPDFVWLLNELFTVVLDGRNEYLSDGVQRALGRAPRDFEEFAKQAAATGVWGEK
jgi:uncharacterized protein YbjT (DUF2867 family)